MVCLNCDLLSDVSDLDNMATHLCQHETHICQVVMKKGMYMQCYFEFLVFILIFLLSYDIGSLLITVSLYISYAVVNVKLFF